MEVLPKSLGGALYEGQIRLEGIMQALIVGLRVLECHHLQLLDYPLLVLELLSHPLCLWPVIYLLCSPPGRSSLGLLQDPYP